MTPSPAAVSALARFLRGSPDLTPLPPAVRCRPMTDDERAAYGSMPVVLPSSADAIHRAMDATTPNDWAGVPDGVVDVSEEEWASKS